MKIKSKVWQWMTVASGCIGLLIGMGAEGTVQMTGQSNSTAYTTAIVLVLLALLFLRFSFAAEDREKREQRERRYGKIDRNHARNQEYSSSDRFAG